eukprot:1012315-Rhodomonas_salina.1
MLIGVKLLCEAVVCRGKGQRFSPPRERGNRASLPSNLKSTRGVWKHLEFSFSGLDHAGSGGRNLNPAPGVAANAPK